MEENNSTGRFYQRLHQQLEDGTTWPAPYLYKFIVPARLEKIAEIEAVFNGLGAKITTRDSSKG
ncbi:MAG: DUF493 domain-containing protein, partial [Marinirhabdus sp.]